MMSHTTTTRSTEQLKLAKRASLASFLGTAFEYLDFSMYAIVSAVVFSHVFFPADDPVAASIGAVTTFALGYVARPIGALVLGPLGDRIGRQKVTLLTMFGMGTATFLMGCLPGYEQIGWVAPALLVTLRLLQGFFVSGEQAGTSSITMEHAPSKRRAFFVSWIQTGVGVGAAAGQLMFIPILALPEDMLFSWGWRIPFLMSAVWTFGILLVRRGLRDSDEFLEKKAAGETERHALIPLIRNNWVGLIRVIFATLINVPGTVIGVFVFGYAVNTVGVPASEMLTVSLIVLLVTTPLFPLWAALSDRIGRRPIFTIGAIGGGLMLFPLMMAVNTGNIVFIGLASFATYALLNAGASIALSIYTEMFPTNVRYSGVAIGTQAGAIVAGFAPSISFALAGFGWVAVALFACGACLLSALAVLTSRETKGVDVGDLGTSPIVQVANRAGKA